MFAWTTEVTEERALLSTKLDGSLPKELIGARRFCPGATGCREAEGPAQGGDRGGGRRLGGGGVACRAGERYQGG